MSNGYAEMLDAYLGAGTALFTPRFGETQVRVALARQQPDGGFPGRRGGSDPYYLDFALRILAFFAPDAPGWRAVGAYLSALPPPRDVVDTFSRLNAARILRAHGIAVTLDAAAHTVPLQRQTLRGGGFARPGGTVVSAYATFVAALCCELLEIPFPRPTRTVRALTALRRPDGGFSELPGDTQGQTNATAAVIAVLIMCDALTATTARKAAHFLTAMQAPDGGLRAHAGAPESDLLSTFTGMLTLTMLDTRTDLDIGGLARFLRAVAAPEGGFYASPTDSDIDLEYSLYGIGLLALVRMHTLTGGME